MTPPTATNALPAKPGQKPAPLSPFAEAIKARADERVVEVFDVSEFFGPGGRTIPRIGFRVPTKWEQDCALAEAHKYVASLAGTVDEIKNDRDILQDAKAAHIAYACCREVRETEPGSAVYVPTGNPAFPGPRWMCENVEPERIAVLLNYANEVRARSAPSPVTIDDGTVEAYVSLCSTADEPEYGLVGCSREYLVQLLILASHKLARERAAAAAPAPAPSETL
jgi:hypothetical protein